MRKVNIEKWGSTYRLVFLGTEAKNGHQGKRDYSDWVGDGEVRGGDVSSDCPRHYGEDGGHSVDRLENNICRARSRVRELALCNSWEHFATFTLDGCKVNRFDLKHYIKRLGEFLGNFNRDYECSVRYLIIPEQHKNGAWHAHGLLSGVPADALAVNEHGHLDWPRYRSRFGFIGLEPVRDPLRTAAYITKYITKDMGSTARESGEHLFYHSRGLEGRQRLGYVFSDGLAAYENEWCGMTWVEAGSPLENLCKAYEAAPKEAIRKNALSKFLDCSAAV